MNGDTLVGLRQNLARYAILSALAIPFSLCASDCLAQPAFQDVTRDAGIGKLVGFVSWLDFNNDFAPDILANTGLFIQTSTGRFTKALEPNVSTNIYSAAVGDLDNDGDVDVYATGFFVPPTFNENIGDGSFRNVTDSLGVEFDAPQADLFPTGISLLDIDNDGDLDMFVGNERGRDTMFRNDGNFVDITDRAGLGGLGGSRNSLVGDVDNDGLVDLFVARSKRFDIPEALHDVPSTLYHNNGDGTFTDIAAQAGIAQSPRDISGAAFLDYDNDGWLDLLVPSREDFPTLLYRNSGDGTFVEVGSQAGIGVPSETGDAAVADFDNDGWVDIFLADWGGFFPDRLFHNNGNGTFSEIAAQANVGSTVVTGRVATADYDSDGYPDLLLSIFRSAEVLYRNLGGENHWLQLHLVGVESNRTAIGTRVVLEAQGLRMIRDVTSGNGYGSQNFLVGFGLGNAERADRIEIHWPSGQVDILTDVSADQRIRVIEGSDGYHAFSRTVLDHDFPESEQIGNPFTLSANLMLSLFDDQAHLDRVFLTGVGDEPVDLLAKSGNPFAYSAPIVLSGKPGFRTMTFHVEEVTSVGRHTAVFRFRIDALPTRPSEIRLTVESVDLGDLAVDRGSTFSTTIHNDGDGPLNVTEIRSDLEGFSVTGIPFVVRPGDSQTVSVRLTSSETGAFEGIVEVLSNDPAAETVTFVVSGTGVVIPGDARADFDGSGQIDFADFLGFAEAFQSSNPTFDIDGSGLVDFNDFLVFAESFGRSVG